MMLEGKTTRPEVLPGSHETLRFDTVLKGVIPPVLTKGHREQVLESVIEGVVVEVVDDVLLQDGAVIHDPGDAGQFNPLLGPGETHLPIAVDLSEPGVSPSVLTPLVTIRSHARTGNGASRWVFEVTLASSASLFTFSRVLKATLISSTDVDGHLSHARVGLLGEAFTPMGLRTWINTSGHGMGLYTEPRVQEVAT